MKRTLALAGAAMLGLPLYCGAQSVHTYTLTDLGTVTYDGGMIDWVNASGLNSAGDVVGNVSSSMPGAPNYAFLYEGGSIINLGTLGGQTSGAEAISDAGQVVGSALTSANVSHAFLYQDNVMQDLGTLGGATSFAYAISSCNGLIAGDGDTSSGNSHAFLYTNGVMQDLGTFGGPNSGARGVNPSGQVVGFANTTATEANGFAYASHAFLYSQGVMQDLGALTRGSSSYAQAINAAGDVAGESEVGTWALTHAFLYRHGVMQDIGTLGAATNTEVTGMNSTGQIVGYASRDPNYPSGTMRGFLYSNGTMTDISDLVDPSDPLAPYAKLDVANGINDSGVILVLGFDSRGGVPHSYLLTPAGASTATTPAPGTCSPGNDSPNTSSGSSSSSGTSTPSSGSSNTTPVPVVAAQATSAGASTSTGGGGAVDTFTLLLLVSLVVGGIAHGRASRSAGIIRRLPGR